MPLSLYEASVPVYLRMLRNLSAILDKAEAHAKAKGMPLSTLAEARLAPDMHPLTRQIQMVSDVAKSGAARLAGAEAPGMPDTETTFPELKERLAKTIAYLETVKPQAIDGGEDRTIELKFPNGAMTFTGRDYLLLFSMPNLFFHVTTAYDVLRNQGVPLGKMDYLGAPK